MKIEDILQTAKLQVYIENKYVNIENALQGLIELLEHSYISPAYSVSDNYILELERKKGVWLEFTFDTVTKFKDIEFSKLLVSIKPKYNFLILHRLSDSKYNGKPIYINLATKTTAFFKMLTAK